MKRLTTDTPQDNIQTALNLFYIKDGWTWVRGGGAAPEYPDVSLCDYVRSMVKTHIPDSDVPDDDDQIGDLMAEWLLEGVDTAEGMIATVYTAGWAFAEIRHRLKAYEDTELEPTDIDRIVDAYGRGMTLRQEAGERLGIVREIRTDRLLELVEADKNGLSVVMCKECVKGFARSKESKMDIFWCDKWKSITRSCDFCSFGERKEVRLHGNV